MKVFLAQVSDRYGWFLDKLPTLPDNCIEVTRGGKRVLPRDYGYLKQQFKLVENHRPSILESYYYVKDRDPGIDRYGQYLLDSGAFTFREHGESVDWDQYIEKLAEYIRNYNINLFFELDIDSMVGYDQVKVYRRKLENLTCKQPIPVWHYNRGKEEFIAMCKDYPYVALGGIAGTRKSSRSKEIQWYQSAWPWFIDTAHEHGAKIHCLGVTAMDRLKKYKFDSVDSSSWSAGSRYGFVWKFNGSEMVQVNSNKDTWLKDGTYCLLLGYIEWLKFQVYADQKL